MLFLCCAGHGFDYNESQLKNHAEAWFLILFFKSCLNLLSQCQLSQFAQDDI